MIKLSRRRKNKPPPIFADLFVETPKRRVLIDVEQPGWLAGAQPLLDRATHLGLVTRKDERLRILLVVGNGRPFYFSKVYGTIDAQGNVNARQMRVACVGFGELHVWLHMDGRVDVGPEPVDVLRRS